MKIQLIEVSGLKGALLGMRLPMCLSLVEAEEKSDSSMSLKVIGSEDMRICKALIKGDTSAGHGQPNSKFLRMIHAQLCVTAPLYWWKEFDTYKVGTVSNSTSTMHRLASSPITLECFETDDADPYAQPMWEFFVNQCEALRKQYLETKDKSYWKELVKLLPSSWLQTRIVDLDYQTLGNIYHWRKNHKLTEWHKFCDFVKEVLPYAKDFIVGE